MKRRTLALLILTFAVLSVSTFYLTVLGVPLGDIYAPQGTSISDGDIDGTIGTEWDDAGGWVVTDLATPNKIRAKHDGTYLYILLVVADTTDHPFDPVTAHDWAGVDFDRNGDEKTMGTTASPDDFEYCDYQILGGEDWWGTGVGNPRGTDTSVGGLNDVVAAKGFNTTHTIWEFKKPLDSGDTNGYDVAMDPSQTDIYGKDRIKIALAYQDGATGKHSDHSKWYLLILTVPTPLTGTLTVTTEPVSGEVFVDGVSWGMAPQSRVIDVGTYNVSFGPVAGYYTPIWQWATVYESTETVVTGVYEPIPPPPGVPSATLCRRSAWPEHHHWDESKDLNQTLTGKIHNDGTLSGLTVRVQFDISYYDDTWSETFYTGTATIDPCTIVNLTVTITRANLAPTGPGGSGKYGTYYVSAQAEYLDPETGGWVKDGKIKNTKFTIVP